MGNDRKRKKKNTLGIRAGDERGREGIERVKNWEKKKWKSSGCCKEGGLERNVGAPANRRARRRETEGQSKIR